MAETHSAFGAAEFGILWDGTLATMPGWEQEGISATQHVPGSNRNITFLLGRGPLTRAFTVLCDTQQHYTNLQAMRHTVATLRVPAAMNDLTGEGVTEIDLFGRIYAEISDVLLLGLSNVQKGVDGAVTCVATFQRDEPEEDEA